MGSSRSAPCRSPLRWLVPGLVAATWWLPRQSAAQASDAVSIQPGLAQYAQRIGLGAPAPAQEGPAAAPMSAAATPGPSPRRGMSQEQIDQEMNNPVGNLYMLPTQFSLVRLKAEGIRNRTVGMGVIQPVLPLKLTQNWNLILHPYLPALFQSPDLEANVVSGRPRLGSATGLGDFGFAAFVSPSQPVKIGDPARNGRIVWGVGPTFQFPTATEATFGHHKYQAGPAAAVAYLDNKFSAILVGQQWWSYAGDKRFPGTNYATLQYIFGYEFAPRWQVTTGTPIITFNWKQSGHNAVTFPLGIGVSHLTFLGPLPVKFGIEFEKTIVNPQRAPYGDNIIRFTIAPVLPQLISGTLF